MNRKIIRNFMSGKHAKGALLSIADQSIVSLSNFLTGVIIARTMPPDQFGSYTLLWSGLLILFGFQNAFITGPLRVLGVKHFLDNGKDFFKSQLILQLLLGSILAILSAFILSVFYSFPIQLVVIYCLCIFFVQLHELVRVIKFNILSIKSLFTMDLVAHALRLMLLVLAASLYTLSIKVSLLCILISSVVGSLLFVDSGVFGKAKALSIINSLKKNWEFGRWLGLESIAYTASAPIYLFLTALWIDTVSVAALYAVVNIMNLLNVLLTGITGYLTPIARKTYLDNNYLEWKKQLTISGIVLVVMSVAIWLVLSLYSEHVLSMIYSPAYGEYSYLVWILGLAYPFRSVNTVCSVAFKTAEMPEVGFYAQLASAIISIILVYPLITVFGLAGAALGLVATQITWAIVYAKEISSGKLTRIVKR